ncbi:MAG: nitroreductase family deazaflavin-dependent oxidoreductase [Nocardioides sp.]|nr:nitroreductase family deazaflavin-dependent oxidoreductase [Nocardioides sp.]
MGIAADLGYQHRPPNPAQRAIQSMAGTRAGSWVFSKSLRHLDDVVSRLSRGQRSAPGMLAGLPVLDLTTTGRRSGQRRTTHLISIPIGDTLALLGTNFGQPRTPAWVLNLEADPRATVAYRGTSLDVVARRTDDAERARVLASAAEVYAGYLKYLERISNREVRIFVLDRPGADD